MNFKPVVAQVVSEIRHPPADYEDRGILDGEHTMSNLDHSRPGDMERALRDDRLVGTHAAVHFNGRVWFEAGQFHETVWVFRRPVATISAASLRDLMVAVNNVYGWE